MLAAPAAVGICSGHVEQQHVSNDHSLIAGNREDRRLAIRGIVWYVDCYRDCRVGVHGAVGDRKSDIIGSSCLTIVRGPCKQSRDLAQTCYCREAGSIWAASA